MRLTIALSKRNHRIFVLSYHSTSLLPGNTPYVRDEADLARFLRWLNEYLDFFFVNLNGVASTLPQLRAKATRIEQSHSLPGHDPYLEGVTTALQHLPRRSAPAVLKSGQQAFKCLLVASTFPPLVGGTCVVYDNLCRYGEGAVIPFVPYINFATGKTIKGVRAHDARVPYKIYRRPLLRPQHQMRAPWALRIGRAVSDLRLLISVLVSLIAIVVRERINIVCIGELTYCGWLVAPCKYLLGLKTIIYVHGEEITTSAPGFAESMKFRWLHMADAIVAVSRFTARSMVERARLSPKKIHIIANGVDTHVFRPMFPCTDLIARYHLEGKRVILSVGRLVERKGIDHVLRAFPTVLARHPDARYLIVGDGPYRSTLERIANSLSISEQVVFAGEVRPEELVAHYALAEIFIQPNRDLADGDTEGFGLVFLEANACGKQAIAGRAGGAPDAVSHGENGLLVDGYDIDAIAGAIDLVLTDDHLRAKLREGALARAAVSSWRDRVGEFRELCTALVSGTWQA